VKLSARSRRRSSKLKRAQLTPTFVSASITDDEPICELADVRRAAGISNVGFCKLKLKRFGGLDLLRKAGLPE
jgi:hypothetical protein